MIKKILCRVLVFVELILGFCFIFGIHKSLSDIFTLAFGFVFCSSLMIIIFQNLSESQIKDILFIDWFKKIGIDIDND